MKKVLSILLSIVLICCLSVNAMAAVESPVADQKVSVTLRKADGTGVVEKADIAYTLDHGVIVTVKADEEAHGEFNNWKIYKVVSAVTGTSAKTKSEITTLNVASGMINLATTTNVVEAVEGTDYKIISGSLTSKELKVQIFSDVIICGNYNNEITDPLVSGGDDSSPQTGDMSVVYAVVIMLIAGAVVFGAKKQFSR